MKTKTQLFTMALALLFFAACQGGGESNSSAEEKEAESEVKDSKEDSEESGLSTTYVLDPQTSQIKWEGTKKFIEFSHKGTIKFKNGKIRVENGAITDAEFTVDMTTIDNTDLKGKDGYEKLVGHLKSDDFFYVERFPEATFELTKIGQSEADGFSHTATGNLTIRGNTNEVNFPINIEYDEAKFNANGAMVFDRTKFDVKYGSDDFFEVVKDKAIKNQVKLTLIIKGAAQAM
ncbi:MAG: YceI family protein [Chitinophagales bacterium]